MHYSKDVYPLDKAEFEGFKFDVPGNLDAYLTGEYGKNYMSFPQNGVEHHGEDAGKLKNWAAANNVDMQEVLTELYKISQEYL